MILYPFELALTPPSILFSLRTLCNFPAFLRMCMMPIYLVPSYQCFCVFTLLSPKFMKLKLTKALNISPPLLHSNSMNNHAQLTSGWADIHRAFHKLLEIFQNVSRNFSKRCSKNNQKLLFVMKVAQKLLESLNVTVHAVS